MRLRLAAVRRGTKPSATGGAKKSRCIRPLPTTRSSAGPLMTSWPSRTMQSTSLLCHGSSTRKIHYRRRISQRSYRRMTRPRSRLFWVANKYNDPGKFTTLIAFEWTSIPNGRNMHRNVFFRNDTGPSNVTPGTSASRFRTTATSPTAGCTHRTNFSADQWMRAMQNGRQPMNH